MLGVNIRRNFLKIHSFIRQSRNMHTLIDISDNVLGAMENHKPIVALETTIITHGMPFPENLNTATDVENVIIKNGSVPATIGVLKGRVKVGLSRAELTELSLPETESVKISRRDFPYVLSRELNGGTTVSGTLLIAKLVGIDVFVTGGMGGVHRDVVDTMDISADLLELSRSPVMVVSSGIKSILDIQRTLEHLETLGVCVAAYRDTKDFPGFYTSKSGFEAPYNVSNPDDAANLILSVKQLGSTSGILLGIPIPEEYSYNEIEINEAIESALKNAKNNSITGKAITPFLLKKLKDITKGQSLETNIAMIKNNAKIGSQIAAKLNEKMKKLVLH